MLYMIVTNDRYELPADIDLSFEAAAEWLRIPPETLRLKLEGRMFWGGPYRAVEQREDEQDYRKLHGKERKKMYQKAYHLAYYQAKKEDKKARARLYYREHKGDFRRRSREQWERKKRTTPEEECRIN